MLRPVKYDEGAKGFLLLLLLGQLFLTNGILLFLGGLVFAFLFYYLQQPLKPAVFSVIFIYHFIQVAAGVWLSNWTGVDINFKSPSTSQAIIASYFGLFFLFLPIIYYQNKIPAFSMSVILEHAKRLSIRRTFYFYLVFFFTMNALALIAFSLSGFTQIIFSFIGLKWMFFLLFGMQVFIKKTMYKEFFFVAGFEFVTGFYSYFSEFKVVIFFSMALFFFFLTRVKLNQLIYGVVASLLIFIGMAYFSSIKGAYREYLNQGSKSQVVTVSKTEALTKLADLAKDNQSDLDKSIESFLERFQYTFHLAKAMDMIPANMDYENGKNWGTTLEFVLTPRLLNPDKPIYQASKKATKYTGIMYSGYEQGVSFSLGYFADGYVDFGLYGMMFPLLVIGFIYGASYYHFVRKSSANYLFNISVVGAMYMEFFAYEMDSTFLLGRLFATLLTYTLLKYTFFPWLMKQLHKPHAKD